MNDLLKAEDLAERLQVRPETVKTWTRDNVIPAIRINPRVIRYDYAEVVDALKRRRVGVQAAAGGCSGWINERPGGQPGRKE